MTNTLSPLLGILLLFTVTFAQKVSTILGDAWTGEVVSTSDETREITIKYLQKGNTETFTGTLNEGYKVTLKDGSSHELKVSEIAIGTRVRLFSKTKEQNVRGTKQKINAISRIDFLGNDEFARLRAQLGVTSNTTVVSNAGRGLPATTPLKLYLAVDDPLVAQSLAAWVDNWNKTSGGKYGSITVASDLTSADVYLARYRGSNLVVDIVPTATVFLVLPDAQGLTVVWRQAVVIDPKQPASPLIEKELEKRMKTRAK